MGNLAVREERGSGPQKKICAGMTVVRNGSGIYVADGQTGRIPQPKLVAIRNPENEKPRESSGPFSREKKGADEPAFKAPEKHVFIPGVI